MLGNKHRKQCTASNPGCHLITVAIATCPEKQRERLCTLPRWFSENWRIAVIAPIRDELSCEQEHHHRYQADRHKS
jgi:hypothetical protein